MKIKTLLTLLAAAALSLHPAFAGEDDTLLAKQMKTMNKSLRTLKKQVADPAKKDENLQLLATIKKSLDESAKLEPMKTKDVPAADKAAYLEKYKTELTDLGKTFDEVEAALKADKPDDAKKAFEKISEQKDKGHKDFAPEDDK